MSDQAFIRTIESRDNKTFKDLMALKQPRRSRKTGLILAEGFRQVEDALHSGVKIRQIVLNSLAMTQSGWSLLAPRWEALQKSVECIRLSDFLFRELSDTAHPQGILAVCVAPELERPVGPAASQGLYLVCENIQDPGNLGTMIRTADAFAFDGVIILDDCVWPFNDKVLRAAMGSCFHIPLLSVPDIGAAAAWLQQSEVRLLAAELGGRDLRGAGSLQPPLAVLIGNEGQGLSADALQVADIRVCIPMPGQAESLNAAAAAAILCYTLMQTREQPFTP